MILILFALVGLAVGGLAGVLGRTWPLLTVIVGAVLMTAAVTAAIATVFGAQTWMSSGDPAPFFVSALTAVGTCLAGNQLFAQAVRTEQRRRLRG